MKLTFQMYLVRINLALFSKDVYQWIGYTDRYSALLFAFLVRYSEHSRTRITDTDKENFDHCTLSSYNRQSIVPSLLYSITSAVVYWFKTRCMATNGIHRRSFRTLNPHTRSCFYVYSKNMFVLRPTSFGSNPNRTWHELYTVDST